MKLSSPAFKHNELIPPVYTCDGDDINPPLKIDDVPAAAKSLVLIMDDPDAPAGTWVHWLVWNMDPKTGEIRQKTVPPKALQGMNSFRKIEYGGPCPPSGTHRYFFKLYALDTTLSLDSKTNSKVLEKAMAGHISAEAVLIGLYKRT
jgi:Raf kinase inhibitor-like YbhB/YbcL family protein